VERQDRLDPELECPLCDGRKSKRIHTVCNQCNRTYIDAAGKELLNTGEQLAFEDWAREKANSRISPLKEQLKDFKTRLHTLKGVVATEAAETLMQRLEGKKFTLDASVLESAEQQARDKLWIEKGGNKLFAQMKTLERKIEFLQSVITGQPAAASKESPLLTSEPEGSNKETNEERRRKSNQSLEALRT